MSTPDPAPVSASTEPAGTPTPPPAPPPVQPAMRTFRQLNYSVFQVVAQSPFLFVLLPILAWLPADLLIEGVVRASYPAGSTDALALSLRLGNFANMFVGIFLTATHVYAVRRLAAGSPLQVGDALRQGLYLWGRLLGIGFAVGVRVLLGLILGIVPGIYYFVQYAFTTQIAIFDGVDAGRAMLRSRKYVKGYGWRILGYCLGYFFLYAPLAFSIAAVTPEGASLLQSAIMNAPLNVVLSLLTIFVTLMYLDRRAEIEPEAWPALPPCLPAAGAPLPPKPRPAPAVIAVISVGALIASLAFRGGVPLVYFSAGEEALARADYAGAIRNLEKAVYWAPDDAQMQNGLGIAYQGAGNLEEAERHLRQAVKLEADNPLFHLNLAHVLALRSQYDAAASHARAARQLGQAAADVDVVEAEIAAGQPDPRAAP